MRPSCVPCLLSPLLRSRRDTGDLDRRVLLTVTLATAVAGLVLVAKNVDLLALVVVHDLGLDLDAGQHPRVAGHGVAVDDEQGRELDRVAHLGGGNLVNLNDVADSNLVLATTAAHDGVHADLTLTRRTAPPQASRPAMNTDDLSQAPRHPEGRGLRECGGPDGHADSQGYGAVAERVKPALRGEGRPDPDGFSRRGPPGRRRTPRRRGGGPGPGPRPGWEPARPWRREAG